MDVLFGCDTVPPLSVTLAVPAAFRIVSLFGTAVVRGKMVSEKLRMRVSAVMSKSKWSKVGLSWSGTYAVALKASLFSTAILAVPAMSVSKVEPTTM
jgi:hypothetical protein